MSRRRTVVAPKTKEELRKHTQPGNARSNTGGLRESLTEEKSGMFQYLPEEIRQEKISFSSGASMPVSMLGILLSFSTALYAFYRYVNRDKNDNYMTESILVLTSALALMLSVKLWKHAEEQCGIQKRRMVEMEGKIEKIKKFIITEAVAKASTENIIFYKSDAEIVLNFIIRETKKAMDDEIRKKIESKFSDLYCEENATESEKELVREVRESNAPYNVIQANIRAAIYEILRDNREIIISFSLQQAREKNILKAANPNIQRADLLESTLNTSIFLEPNFIFHTSMIELGHVIAESVRQVSYPAELDGNLEAEEEKTFELNQSQSEKPLPLQKFNREDCSEIVIATGIKKEKIKTRPAAPATLFSQKASHAETAGEEKFDFTPSKKLHLELREIRAPGSKIEKEYTLYPMPRYSAELSEKITFYAFFSDSVQADKLICNDFPSYVKSLSGKVGDQTCPLSTRLSEAEKRNGYLLKVKLFDANIQDPGELRIAGRYFTKIKDPDDARKEIGIVVFDYIIDKKLSGKIRTDPELNNSFYHTVNVSVIPWGKPHHRTEPAPD